MMAISFQFLMVCGSSYLIKSRELNICHVSVGAFSLARRLSNQVELSWHLNVCMTPLEMKKVLSGAATPEVSWSAVLHRLQCTVPAGTNE